jgi:hypothetical protein
MGACHAVKGFVATRMVRPTDDPKTHMLRMRVSETFLKPLDTWRKKQPDKPSRSEAIRRLVFQALGLTEKP